MIGLHLMTSFQQLLVRTHRVLQINHHNLPQQSPRDSLTCSQLSPLKRLQHIMQQLPTQPMCKFLALLQHHCQLPFSQPFQHLHPRPLLPLPHWTCFSTSLYLLPNQRQVQHRSDRIHLLIFSARRPHAKLNFHLHSLTFILMPFNLSLKHINNTNLNLSNLNLKQCQTLQ